MVIFGKCGANKGGAWGRGFGEGEGSMFAEVDAGLEG